MGRYLIIKYLKNCEPNTLNNLQREVKNSIRDKNLMMKMLNLYWNERKIYEVLREKERAREDIKC